MCRHPLRRFALAAALALSLLAVPVAHAAGGPGWTSPWSSLLAWWQAVAGALTGGSQDAPEGEAGPSWDPDGLTGEEGPHIDPIGFEAGPQIDPIGVDGDAGPGPDPDGLTGDAGPQADPIG